MSKELYRLRETAYSKLHHSYDQKSKEAFLFFAVDPTAFDYRGYNITKLFSAKMLKYVRTASAGPRIGAPTEVNLTAISSDKLDISLEADNLLFFTGRDYSVQEGIRYDYKIILTFLVDDIKDTVKGDYIKPKLDRNAGNFAANIHRVSHFMPTVKYEKGIAIPEFSSLEIKFNNFKTTTATSMSNYISSTFDNFLLDKKTELHLKHTKFKRVDEFKKQKYDSTVVDLGGLKSTATSSGKRAQGEYSANSFIKVHTVKSKQLLKLEYLHGYGETLVDNHLSAISERWQPLTTEIINNIDSDKSILVRVGNPGNISDRYFFVSAGSGGLERETEGVAL
jgi:hypothetical protein